MIKAKDIMNTNVVTVSKDDSLVEVGKLMVLNSITGIPVVDDDMTPLGLITEKDILHLFEILQYSADRTVNTSMTVPPMSFDVETDLLKLVDCLKDHDFRRVPITSKGKIVGIISRSDLISHMIKQRDDRDL
jgi:CBS domain-containing protein